MSHDLDAVFWRARRRLPPAFWGEFLPRHWRPDMQALFGMAPWEDAGDGFWQPVPYRGRGLGKLGLVMAVRIGDPWGGDMADYGFPPWVRLSATGAPTEASSRRMLARHALAGPEILDLLLLPGADLRKPPLRLSGMATALGSAREPVCWQDRAERPVLVVRSVDRWLARWQQGACLPLGSRADQAGFLRGLHAGIHTEDVAHGKALQAMMAREAPALPSIFVESAEDAA